MVSQFGSLGYTIMGKTADITVVQKTIIDTLHKEGKPQTFIAKEAGCSQSAVSKHVNRKLNRSLMRIVKQNRFKNLGELHKEWTEAGVKASRATTHRRVKEFGHSCHQRRLTWAKEKTNWTVAQWSKVLFSDESKFCISFGNQGPRVWRKGGEAHSPSCLMFSVKFPQSVMIWGAMLVKWAWCWCAWLASKLTRLEPHRESMGYCQEENEKQETKQMQMSWRPLSKKPVLPHHLSSATNWSPPCHAELRQ